MIRAMRVYKEVGYDGMIMPDHAPHIEGDEGGRAGVCFRVRLHRRTDPDGRISLLGKTGKRYRSPA